MLIFAPVPISPDDLCPVILNLSSFIEGYPTISQLNPLTYFPQGISYVEDFDEWYMRFILTNKEAYKAFLDIMRPLYNGADVCILINPNNEFSNRLVDSLISFIYKRYEYVSNLLIGYDLDDIDTLKEGTFSASGIHLLDEEFKIYANTYGIKNLYTDPEN